MGVKREEKKIHVIGNSIHIELSWTNLEFYLNTANIDRTSYGYVYFFKFKVSPSLTQA